MLIIPQNNQKQQEIEEGEEDVEDVEEKYHNQILLDQRDKKLLKNMMLTSLKMKNDLFKF